MKLKPLTVSFISFFSMLLVVSLIGLISGQHIVHYLRQELIEHGISHHQQVLSGIKPLLEHSLQDGVPPPIIIKNFQNFIDHAEPFGLRLYLWNEQQVLADSQNHRLPYPLPDLPLVDLNRNQPIDDLSDWQGHARLQRGEQVDLISAAVIADSNWRLVVRSELSPLLQFIEGLHLHLDTVLLTTDFIIGLLGFILLRWIGRRYELSLEQQIAERTAELKQANQKLLEQACLATIGKTTAVLTHEMRNPLASIKLALSSIAKEPALSERAMRRIQLVQQEVDRLENLLNETLDYARPIKKDPLPQALDQLLERVLELEQPQLQAKDLHYIWQQRQDCPKLYLDGQKMQQVLLNAIKNAIEASPQGGQIQISLRCQDQGIELKICNLGQIAAEIKNRAFDFFFTTKAKGTGLGLGLVKRVVEEHGGSVSLDNEDQWTCMRIELPYADQKTD